MNPWLGWDFSRKKSFLERVSYLSGSELGWSQVPQDMELWSPFQMAELYGL